MLINYIEWNSRIVGDATELWLFRFPPSIDNGDDASTFTQAKDGKLSL